MENTKTASSLVLEAKVALIDTSILDMICNPSNPLKLGKVGRSIRKDESMCELYVIDTRARFQEELTYDHRRFNMLMQVSGQTGYQYVVIITK